MSHQVSSISITDVLLRAVEQSPSVVVITDMEGRIEYVNSAFCRLTGYSMEEAQGQYVSMLKSGLMSNDVYRDLWTDLNAGSDWHGEFRNRKKNGALYWEDATISSIRNAVGVTEHYLKVAEDITRQKSAEAELKASQERYERVVMATHSFMFTVSSEDGRPVHTVHYPGSLAVTGYTREEYDANPMLWSTMIIEKDLGSVTAQIEAVLHHKNTRTIEHRIRHKNGSTRWIRNVSVPTFDERGKMTGYDGLISDITTLKEAQLQGEALLGEVRRMAVRDPLTGLFSRRGLEDELNRAWQLGQRQGRPTGLLMLDIDHFKVFNDTYGHTVGDEILIQASQLILSAGRASDVVCRCGGDEIVVILPLADLDETRQAAERLLETFRKHIFCRETHGLRVTISIGLAVGNAGKETQQKILMRADQALYRAKREGRNRACFWDADFTTDVMKLQDTSSGAAGMSKQKEVSMCKARVLVTDDDPSICLFLEAVLENDHYSVATTGSAAEAIQAAEKERGLIDVALVDIRLPDQNGYEVLRRLHLIDETMAVILITGHATMDAAVEGVRNAASDFMEKPLSPDQTIAVVERALRHRHLMRENLYYQQHLEEMVAERSLALSHALHRINQSHRTTLEVMATMIGIRENKTAEHSRRVARMAQALAREVGVSDADMETIGHGALLHDIGKIAIPDSILLKPSALTDEEWKVMKTHPQLGRDIVSTCPALEDAAEIVFSHQERFDGSGYPRGLNGKEICLGARIFAAVDSYDAIRSARAYSPGRSVETAIEEIVRGKGTQFDPEVVDAFLRCQSEIESVVGEPQDDAQEHVHASGAGYAVKSPSLLISATQQL